MLFVHLQITRSVSNISAMRGKNESTIMTPTHRLSEVASAEMCYGVFRKLESVRGGGERITAGRPPQSRLSVAVQSPPTTPVSPRVSAFAYNTAAADDDDDDHDCCNFDRETYSVYGCDTATAVTTSTTATVTTDAASTGGRDDCGLSDFGGAVAWDDYDYCCSAATAVDTTVDLRGGSAAPFSHTPMGSTTKLVGIDANSDDTPKVRTQHPLRYQY